MKWWDGSIFQLSPEGRFWKDHWYPLNSILAFIIQHPELDFLCAGLPDVTSFQPHLYPAFHIHFSGFVTFCHGGPIPWACAVRSSRFFWHLWCCDIFVVDMDSTEGYSLASWLEFLCLCWTSWWLSLPTPWSSPACQSLAWLCKMKRCNCDIMGFSGQAATSKGHWVGQGDLGLHCICSELRLCTVAWRVLVLG